LSPDIDLTAINRGIVKADIQTTLKMTRSTMQVSNIFEFYFSINYKQDNISNGRV